MITAAFAKQKLKYVNLNQQEKDKAIALQDGVKKKRREAETNRN